MHLLTPTRAIWCNSWFSAIAVSHVTAVKISVLCVISAFERSLMLDFNYTGKPCCSRETAWCLCKIRFRYYRNIQQHCAVLPAIAQHLAYLVCFWTLCYGRVSITSLQAKRGVKFFGYNPQTYHNTPLPLPLPCLVCLQPGSVFQHTRRE